MVVYKKGKHFRCCTYDIVLLEGDPQEHEFKFKLFNSSFFFYNNVYHPYNMNTNTEKVTHTAWKM